MEPRGNGAAHFISVKTLREACFFADPFWQNSLFFSLGFAFYSYFGPFKMPTLYKVITERKHVLGLKEMPHIIKFTILCTSGIREVLSFS